MTGAHLIPPHLIAFWRDVEMLVQTLFSLFGGPEVLAQRRVVQREEYTLLARWLNSAEAFLRRLLLIEAAETPVVLKPARKTKQRVRTHKAEAAFDLDNPESWRVSFRMSFSEKASIRTGRRSEAQRFIDAAPLAKRFEALLRAYNDPRAIIARLAKRLKRDPLSISMRFFMEKTHESVGVGEPFDDAGLMLEKRCGRAIPLNFSGF